jgi:hypothetical protein
MKQSFLLFALLGLLFVGTSSCRKPVQEFAYDGVITGQDYRKCACCGGYLITIDKQEYMFWDVPAASSLDLRNATFPIEVKLDWKNAANACTHNLIEVIRIKKK